MSYIFNILFFLVILGILFAGNYYIYFVLTRLLVLNSHWRFIVAFIFSAMTLSFFFSTLVAHWKENILTRVCYYVSALWLGWLANLLLFSFIFWVAHLILKKYGLDYDFKLGIAILICSFLLLVYGMINAMYPRVKEFSVSMKNLPDFWVGKKIVQISDAHLGHVQDEKYLSDLILEINKQKPDLVFITGDLFDGMDGDFGVRMDELNKIDAPRGIFFVTGNHETYFGLEKVEKLLENTKVRRLSDSNIFLHGLNIVGVDYPVVNSQTKNIVGTLQAMKNINFQKPTVLLYHSPTQVDKIKALGGNILMLSGHTHGGQLWPFNLVMRLIYGRYSTGLHADGDFTIYTSSGAGTWGPPVRTVGYPEIVSIILQKK